VVNRQTQTLDSEEVAVGREPPFREDLRSESEEHPLLETVTRRLLVKALGAGKHCVL
jgi:hypothetical protein